MIRRLHRAFPSDSRGAAAVEFALVAPVLLIGMMGVFDLGHNMYTASVLHGAIQKTARDSTIEGAAGQGAILDQRVTDMVRRIAPGATLQFNRDSYTTFSNVSQPEDFTDVNGSGACDANEPFEDANGNGSWDADMGKTGFGGARDAVMYEVSVTYKRPFPISKLIGQSDMFTTVVRTVLRNQPFGPQGNSTTPGTCP
ncbi:MAG: pilus assembly protein [Sphingomonadaceae bacterium]|nr:pilus assembly protein [Sphingomonadaceae bacterium]